MPAEKFIPLSKIITFFTLDILLPPEKRFTNKEFKQLLQTSYLETLVDNWLTQFHPASDQSLEGDIYSQNQKRTRSIVEEVSNSIDAHPEAIHCIIRDGYYEIREQNGQGMSPEIVCTKYLPPKATTKDTSEKQIGRFGIGSFTKLAHLNDPNASVIVETRARGEIGCRLEYRLKDGKLQVSMRADDTITAYGTVTKVTSSEITANDYTAMLSEHIGDDLQIPLTINGAAFVPEANTHHAAICINNIRIQRSVQSEHSNTTKVTWNLRHGTTISESRNKIILDNDVIRAEICQRIAEISKLGYPEWVRYANTIAPLVAQLQTSNNSLLAKDNVFDYLLRITHQKLGMQACVPDTELYQPLSTANIRLHPSLLPTDWIKRAGVLAHEFKNDATKILLADFSKIDETPFIYDKEAGCVFVAKEYYEKLKSEHNLGLLELIFKYPPDEIKAELSNQIDEVANHQKGVIFKDELTQHPFHDLYRQHGLLWLYGAEATQQILQTQPDAANILAQAKSLISLYPIQKYITRKHSEYITNAAGPLLAFRVNGQRYYCDLHVNGERTIYDENFQILRGQKWDLARAKIQQLYDRYSDNKSAYSDDIELVIKDDEIFAVPNSKDEYDLVNGKGEIVDPRFSCRFLRAEALGNNYYHISKCYAQTESEEFIYHSRRGIITKIKEECLKWSALPDTNLLAGREHGKITSLFDMGTEQFILNDSGMIMQQGQFLLAVEDKTNQKRDYEAFMFPSDKTKIFELTNLSGDLLYRFKNEIYDPLYFDCKMVDENNCNLSIITKRGDVHLIQIQRTAENITHRYFSPEQTIGYPVAAIIHTDSDNNNTLQFLDGNHNLPLSFKFAQPYRNHSAVSSYLDDYDKPTIEQLFHHQPVIISHENEFAILDPITFALIPINKTLAHSATKLIKRNNYYYIQHKNPDHKPQDNDNNLLGDDRDYFLDTVYDPVGNHVATAKEVIIHPAKTGDCIQINDEIFLPGGRKLDCPPVKYVTIFSDGKTDFIAIIPNGESHDTYIYDFDGNLLSEKNTSYVSKNSEDSYSVSYNNPYRNWLYTPLSKIERGRLHGSNTHPDKNADDLIVQGYGKTNRLLTKAGYPFFNEEVPEYYELLRNHIGKIKASEKQQEAIFKPLTPEQLTNKNTFANLNYLNQLSLDTFQYSKCLRFIDWPAYYFQILTLHVDQLNYIPKFTPEIAHDHETIIHFCSAFSARDRDLVLSIYSFILKINHGEMSESLAQKMIDTIECYGMNALSDLQKFLEAKQYDLEFITDFSERKELIDAMPPISGNICYYLLYPEKQLLSAEQQPCFPPLQSQQKISLLNFMTAFQFDDRLLQALNNPPLFINEINKWGNYADKSHTLRLLQHAIYHQADPNKHLYERELLQNALDAYIALDVKGDEAHIPVQLYRDNNHCVFRMENKGLGMSLQDIFYYFALIGTSSKRANRHQRFIGGHGVGAFTVYHNAEVVRLKSGQNDGQIYCAEFRPVYKDNKIIDIEMTWEVRPGNFDGVTIERVDRSNKATLEAARHHRTFKMHGRTVNAATANITLNDQQINYNRSIIASADIPQIGKLTLSQAPEDMITAGGLSVRPIDNLDSFIPEEIRSVVRKTGLIIDLPKQIPLNRERTEVIDADHVYEFLKPYLLNTYIEGYVRLFMYNHIALTELPYDFFENFNVYIRYMEKLNPELQQDADDIIHHRPLRNFEKYQSIAQLHELMAYLPLFKIRHDKDAMAITNPLQKEAYSLIELAQYYREYRKLPNLESEPMCVRLFISNYESSLHSQRFQLDYASRFGKHPEIDWFSTPLNPAPPLWEAMLEMSSYLATCMGIPNVRFGLSTRTLGDILHTNRGTRDIFWNVFNLADHDSEMHQLMDDLNNHRRINKATLNRVLNNIAHELVHAWYEEKCSTTHNRGFTLKQRKLLINLSRNFTTEQLMENLQQIFSKYVPNKKEGFLFDSRELLDSQVASKNNYSPVYNLFPALLSFPPADKMDIDERPKNN